MSDPTPEALDDEFEEVTDEDREDVTDEDPADDTDADDDADDADDDHTAHLEQEGDIAADFLEQLLDIADLDGDIDVDIEGDRAAVSIVDSEDGRVPRRLIGTDGRVLEALQELTRMAVQAETGERSRLMLDIGEHRADRRKALVKEAHQAVRAVRASGKAKALAPMSAFERKVIHDVVLANGLTSESEGTEPHRHVVVKPGSGRS